MSSVYIVVSCCCGEYETDAVFSTKEKADEYAATCSFGKVEEWELDVAKMKTAYHVHIDDSGNEIRRWSSLERTEWNSEQEDDIESAFYPGYCSYGSSFRNYDVALKVARDKRAEVLATEAGV
jgi:hypothetical protein